MEKNNANVCTQIRGSEYKYPAKHRPISPPYSEWERKKTQKPMHPKLSLNSTSNMLKNISRIKTYCAFSYFTTMLMSKIKKKKSHAYPLFVYQRSCQTFSQNWKTTTPEKNPLPKTGTRAFKAAPHCRKNQITPKLTSVKTHTLQTLSPPCCTELAPLSRICSSEVLKTIMRGEEAQRGAAAHRSTAGCWTDAPPAATAAAAQRWAHRYRRYTRLISGQSAEHAHTQT